MPITMLNAGRRKPKKKTRSGHQPYVKPKGIIAEIERRADIVDFQTHLSQVCVALVIAELFEALHEAFDYLFDFCHEWYDRLEWHIIKVDEEEERWRMLLKEYFSKEDIDSIITYSASHFHNADLEKTRVSLRSRSMMKAVRRGMVSPKMAGATLLMVMAKSLAVDYIDIRVRNLVKTIVDILGAKETEAHVRKKVSPIINFDLVALIGRMSEIIQEEYLLSADAVDDILYYKGLKEAIHDYSVDFYEGFNGLEMIRISDMCHNTKTP